MSPLPVDELLARHAQDLSRILATADPLVGGRYLHWDDVRHRSPPDGLSHEAWWLGIAWSRHTSREAMPLVNKNGRPFGLTHVAPVRQGLHRIDQALGMTGPSSEVRAMTDAHGGPWMLANSRMEEAIRSSQLEGATTTRARAREMLRRGTAPSNRSERMIVNVYRAMEKLEGLSGGDLSLGDILELHSVLVEGALDEPEKAGAFRVAADETVVELRGSIDTAHVPPPAADLPGRMEAILAFANEDTPNEWLHPVLRSIILHFMIGYDHPFVDGNGRVARALFYWSMLRRGYDSTKYLSLSRVLREAPGQYARAYLLTETDDGDLTYFVLHQIAAILKTIEALQTWADEKVESTHALEASLRESPWLNHRQLRLLGHALRHPGFQYTVHSHGTSHRVVTNTARADLNELADRRLLLKVREGRRDTFVVPADLEQRILEATAPRPLPDG